MPWREGSCRGGCRDLVLGLFFSTSTKAEFVGRARQQGSGGGRRREGGGRRVGGKGWGDFGNGGQVKNLAG